MSFEVTVTPTVYDVEVEVNPSVQPFDVEVTVGNVPDLDLTTNGDSGASTFDPLTGELNIPEYTLDGLGGVPESRTLTINGTTQDLSANRTFTIPTHDAVTIGTANGLTLSGQVLSLGLASSGANGALSSTDWTTFNGKQNALGFTPEDVANKSTDTGLGTSNSLYPSQGAVKSYVDTGLSGKENTLGFTPENVANKAINFTSPDDTKYPTTLAVSTALAGKQDVLTNPITGTGVAGQVAFWDGTSTQSGSTNLLFDNVTGLLTVTGGLTVNGGTTTPHIRGSALRVSNTANGASGRLTIGSINFIDGDSGTYYFRNSGNTLLSLFSNNNVAINSTTDAGFRLDVNGTARVQGALSVTTGGASITGGLVVDTINFNLGGGSISTNIRIGTQALTSNTTGGSNLAFGAFSLNANTTGANNLAFGISSFRNNGTGSENIAIGPNAGRFIADGVTPATTSNNSIFIGTSAYPNGDNQINQIVIGRSAIGLGSNTTVIGNSSTTFGRWWGSLLVGTSTNEASSILTLASTTKGFLPPRMTGAQAEAIASPAEGLLVYSTDGTGTTITSKGWWGFNGSTWAQLN